MKQQKFSICDRWKSLGFALNGLKIFLRYEQNARIHLVCGILVIVMGVLLKISAMNWIAVVFAVGLVPSLELINSSIERMADFVSPEKHEAIKRIKDLSAASVLVGAIAAAIIGMLVFIPKILERC